MERFNPADYSSYDQLPEGAKPFFVEDGNREKGSYILLEAYENDEIYRIRAQAEDTLKLRNKYKKQNLLEKFLRKRESLSPSEKTTIQDIAHEKALALYNTYQQEVAAADQILQNLTFEKTSVSHSFTKEVIQGNINGLSIHIARGKNDTNDHAPLRTVGTIDGTPIEEYQAAEIWRKYRPFFGQDPTYQEHLFRELQGKRVVEDLFFDIERASQQELVRMKEEAEERRIQDLINTVLAAPTTTTTP